MTEKIRLALGADHGGFQLKEILKTYIQKNHPDWQILDLGTHSEDSVHYPEYAKRVCEALLSQKATHGIIVCGTGIGVSIQANRFRGIRAALVLNIEMAKMAKAHNNANVLCLGGRTSDPKAAKQWVDTWITTKFEGGRHADRIAMLDQ